MDKLVWQYGPAAMSVPRAIRRRAISEARLPRRADVMTYSFGAEEVVVPTAPDTASGSSGIPRLALRTKRLPPPFVAEVPDSTLVGVHAVPFTRDGRMLLTGFLDSLSHVALEPHPELEAWVSGEPLGQASQELCERLSAQPVCSFVGRFDSNYFHWLINFCSQLEALGQYLERTGHEPALLIRESAPRFARESLALLGIKQQHVIGWPMSWVPSDRPPLREHLSAVVPRLVVPSWRGDRHTFSPRSLSWLRATFLRAAREEPTPAPGAQTRNETHAPVRLYIARRPDGWRTVINTDELECFLGERDFTTIRPEDHPLRDQIHLFSRARVIVGMHGAGLTNIVFAPDAHLVELAGRYGTSAYFSISDALGNGFTRVFCVDSGDDVQVDTKALRSALSRIDA